MFGYKALALAALTTTLAISGARADTPAFSVNAPVIDNHSPNSPINLDMLFVDFGTEYVTALGFYTAFASSDHEVALYDQDGSLVADTMVSRSGPSIDGYAYQSINPIALTPNSFYFLVDFVGADDWGYGTTRPGTAANIQYFGHSYKYANAITFEHDTQNIAGGSGGTYYGPNILTSASPTPEPASWALALIGFSGLGAVLRRRREPARA